MLSKKLKYIYRAAFLTALLCLFSCDGGDDDGRRLGEEIVGTWQRGWNEGDIIIEGDPDTKPDNFTYDLFYFYGDGKYNGMVRDGSFLTVDTDGEMIFEGTYQCDNNNLKLDCVNSEGESRKILAQVLRFTDKEMQIRYVNDEYDVTVTVIIRKVSDLVK
jgi:hypothetical protein